MDYTLQEFVVETPYHNWRLDRFIHACVPRLSRSKIQEMIRAQVVLGGDAMRSSMRVRAGQKLTLRRILRPEPAAPRHFDVLYEDDSVMVIDKPAGLPVHATARYYHNTLTAVLRERFAPNSPPILCHRIDKETSGLMLLAQSWSTEVMLKAAFRQRLVKKKYLAIVHGDPGPEGIVDAPIGADPGKIAVKCIIRDDGLPAVTRYVRVAQRGRFSLVEAYPETGRQHQIRLHLASLGTPIVGDKLYGENPYDLFTFLSDGFTDELAQRLLLPRQALHAASIAFTHPHTQKPVMIDCPMPQDMQQFWQSAIT